MTQNVRISKCKNVLAKCYILNWSKETFVIKKVKVTVSWTYVIGDLKGEKTVGIFCKKQLQKKQIKNSIVLKKIIKRKSDNLYVKWKSYESYFNN